MKKVVSLFFLGLLTGCSAVMIQSPTPAYGPTEGKQPGQIVYDPMFTASQEDAYQQMYNACNGQYRILDQQLKQKAEVTTYEAYQTPSDKIRANKRTTSQEYMAVTFECI